VRKVRTEKVTNKFEDILVKKPKEEAFLSDSEPSEDNFEESQILKLIPKKCGK